MPFFSLSDSQLPHFKHLLIDEFQDTSPGQYDMIRRLYSPSASLFVIGDPLQSIYSFRGASPGIFSQLRRDFPHIKTLQLTQNYRSGTDLVAISNRLFPQAGLSSAVSFSTAVRLIATFDHASEANWIINDINAKIGGLGHIDASSLSHQAGDSPSVNFSQFAVIVRSRFLVHPLIRQLSASGIPYQFIGAESSLNHPLVTSLALSLQFLHRPDPFLLSQLQALQLKPDYIDFLQSCPASGSLLTLATRLFNKINPSPPPSLSALFNELTSYLVQFNDHPKPLSAFDQFWDKFSSDNFYDPRADRVTISTVHAAKGLEFDYLYLPALEEGNFPSHKSLEDEEEKRLFYVALTRARRQLNLLYASRRPRRFSLQPSRYIQIIRGHPLMELADPSFTKASVRFLKKSQRTLF